MTLQLDAEAGPNTVCEVKIVRQRGQGALLARFDGNWLIAQISDQLLRYIFELAAASTLQYVWVVLCVRVRRFFNWWKRLEAKPM